MKNDCTGFKIVWLLNCFHVFTLSWNTSKDKSGINPVILTRFWAWVAKGSSWKRSFITALFWLKLCLSVLLLLTCIKKVKFAFQAASPDCFSRCTVQLLMYQSTQMFLGLVGNVKAHYWGTAELQAQNHFLKDLYTGVSGTEVFWLHVKPSSSCRVLGMSTSVLLTCAPCQSPLTLCVKCDRDNSDSVMSLKHHSWVHLVLQQQHFTPVWSLSGLLFWGTGCLWLYLYGEIGTLRQRCGISDFICEESPISPGLTTVLSYKEGAAFYNKLCFISQEEHCLMQFSYFLSAELNLRQNF